jgi:hypothetical protein
METFENWYTNILEEVATSPAKSLSGDVDTIISSLDSLVKELTEELDSPEFNEVNEADGEAPSKVWQWIWWMPKARKAQQKVNKIRLNIADIESAARDVADATQKERMTAKANQIKDQAETLQTLVDDKFSTKGEIVTKAIQNEKIAGKLAVIKRISGLEDDPKKATSYKEKIAELTAKYREEEAAIKQLEPSEVDKKAEKEAQQSAQESLVNRANAVGLNELATEIGSKLDWQVNEGTVLHQKYNELIKKAEYTNTLNESKYNNFNVKDNFSRLL